MVGLQLLEQAAVVRDYQYAKAVLLRRFLNPLCDNSEAVDIQSRIKLIENRPRKIAPADRSQWRQVAWHASREVSAGIVKGVTYTSTPGLTDDLRNAGATWVDQEVCVDAAHRRVSSRRPGDLPAFMAAMIEMMAAPAA